MKIVTWPEGKRKKCLLESTSQPDVNALYKKIALCYFAMQTVNSELLHSLLSWDTKWMSIIMNTLCYSKRVGRQVNECPYYKLCSYQVESWSIKRPIKCTSNSLYTELNTFFYLGTEGKLNTNKSFNMAPKLWVWYRLTRHHVPTATFTVFTRTVLPQGCFVAYISEVWR